ncbi:FIST N domain [Chlorella sorokiniana]|uniref:FIST N domain n=1 Tax=Chlorella sorokiniana TaxID=3076 RepID=A0A2P6TLZ7_CHLSO|nr:FIST N domain [Chlorella sorokiniana]|eukprot:PRW45354.1 FIST N domain [Chlorella sorokiniana]
MASMEASDLLSLTDELLLAILHRCGAPAVARCATLCKRLQTLQGQLAGLPAFAAAATIEGAEEQSVEDAVTGAVSAALHQMPAAVDFCLCFVATPGRSAADREALRQVVAWCQARLPAGTVVVGCTGRGLFGVQGGLPVELDPQPQRGERAKRAATVLLGRLPGCAVRAFAAPNCPQGWQSEAACRAWLGLAGLDAAEAVALDPISCLLLAHSSAGGDVYDCLDGLQVALPHMLVTGGIASGVGELFCSEPLRQPEEPSGSAEAATGKQAAQRRPKYCGLLLCRRPGAAASSAAAGGMAAQGMRGAPPLLVKLNVIREFGTLQHPNNHGDPDEMELLGLTGAYLPDGSDAMPVLRRLASRQEQLGMWAAPSSAELGSFDEAAAAGRPAVMLQLYGAVEDGEALATASDETSLRAVMAAADSGVLCVQPLKLSAEGAIEALRQGVEALVGAHPGAHPLLPTANAGLVLVSCTAKGRQMHGSIGAEAEVVQQASSGLPMCGLYADGEIGPEVCNARCGLRWAGAAQATADGGAAGRATGNGPAAAGSKLQGFTTIVTSYSS